MKEIFILFLAYVGPAPDAEPSFITSRHETVEDCLNEGKRIMARFQHHASIGDMGYFCGVSRLDPRARTHS